MRTWISAARAFADLVDRLDHGDGPGHGVDHRDGPGLGAWSLRDLVGHTCSAGLSAVITVADATTEDITSPEGYYAFAKSVDPALFETAVAMSTEDARRIGERLGDDPAAAVRHLVDQAIAALGAEDRLIASAAGGMRLHAWLPTRTFELAVHSLDIAAATGLSADVPDQVISDAAALAARIAAATGDGPAVLLAMTGRGHLTRDFSVV
ncbi:MAG TPA: maleylpyruvate isomerase N-terminal domain-containing protein [Pseudonocardiaceae bacterium]|nr:maleylpyruvate isomerase N-terminal domain-containing protein [Pseudonocardiaceae bacterium]